MLSELTGVYSISSLLLIRRNVPVKFRDVIDNVLGGQLEFQYFHRLAGVQCCWGAGVTRREGLWRGMSLLYFNGMQWRGEGLAV
jgi:hypothetical protein